MLELYPWRCCGDAASSISDPYDRRVTTVERNAARVLVVDARDRVLLFRWTHPGAVDRGHWWITPGGGLDPGESPRQGAARELFEETGLVLAPDTLGEPVHEREIDTDIDGVMVHQHELFFLARVDAHEVDTSGFTELETRAMSDHRWWTRDELSTTSERVSPNNLLELLPC